MLESLCVENQDEGKSGEDVLGCFDPLLSVKVHDRVSGAMPSASFFTPVVRKAMVARVPSTLITTPFPKVG